MPLPASRQHQFAVLDGLRGVVALSVLGFHLVQQHEETGLPFAGLAVDFFYMLSGFVMAFAYEHKLRTGAMDLKSFAWTRVVRLYPLLLLGTSTGIALALLAAATKGGMTYQQIAVSGLLSLLLLPSYVFPQWSTAFPFNMASWSLSFEVFASAVFAVIAPRLTTRVLIATVGVSALLLVGVAIRHGSIYGGYDQDNFGYGFGRVLFPFFAGVLIFRLRRRPRHAPLLAFGLFAATVAFLTIPGGTPDRMTLLGAMLVLPAVIFLGAALDVGPRLSRAFRFAGNLSYPLYILQSPILLVGQEALKHVHLGTAGLWLFGLAEAGVILGVAFAALVLFDVPIRRAIRGRSAARAPMLVKSGEA
jgi:peptidoglycan/LPS O-acetylase OafA/YrhL